MSEEKWTPGPWTCGVWEGETKYSIMQGDSLETVAVTKTEANANLIAAAPDLYAVLSAVEWVEEEEGVGVFFCPRCLKYKERGHTMNCPLNAALKKARGEA